MDIVIHEEPSDNGKVVRVERTTEEAIAYQKAAAAALKDFQYESDQQALDDYVTVHWAWYRKGQDTKTVVI